MSHTSPTPLQPPCEVAAYGAGRAALRARRLGDRAGALARSASKLSLAVLACLGLAGTARPLAPPQVLWLQDGRVTQQARAVLDTLRNAQAYGLQGRDYALPLSATQLDAVITNEADAATRKSFDAALSRAAARFIRDLHQGRIDPHRAGFDLPEPAADFDVMVELRRLASSQHVATTLASLEPAAPPYHRLETALANYRALALDLSLTALPALPKRSIFPGEEYAGVPQLRRLLEALGDLAPRAAAPLAGSVLDEELVAAVVRFQQRHGITADGTIGRRTFMALTTPLSLRVRQIELAMERWRWLNAVERPSVVVNIPQFMLFAVSHASGAEAATIEMRVIVGKTYPHMRTPIFSSRITQVVFHPYWDVPRGILLRELLPQIRANPASLDRDHMEIVAGQSDDARVLSPTPATLAGLANGTLRLRQRPGPDNALGEVKFSMPNNYNVYLHSTPQHALFDRSARTFSHGCIRVSEPALLAQYVLRSARGTWDREAIEAALSGTTTQHIRLDHPVPVVVFYATAVVTRSEGVLFFDDIYGHDARLQQLLEEAARSGQP